MTGAGNTPSAPRSVRRIGSGLTASPWPRLALVGAAFAAWYFVFPSALTLGITLMLLAGWATAWDLLGG